MNRRTRHTGVTRLRTVVLGSMALWGAVLLGAGCSKPCSTTSQCGDSEVCAAALCQALSCETAALLRDPKSGQCVALSGCFLTEDQRSWETCAEDPCKGKDESSCIEDARCQPGYNNPDVRLERYGDLTSSNIGCSGGGFDGDVAPVPDSRGFGQQPGVNNGDLPKHPAPLASACLSGSARVFSGCRAVPQIAPQKSCVELTSTQCTSRRDCTTDPSRGLQTDPVIPRPTVGINEGQPSQPGSAQLGRNLGQCFDRNPRSTSCGAGDALSCLTNPECQAVGSACYCPPGAECSCDGGRFMGCESNDRLRRCSSSADCRSGERCDNDEACIAPRTFIGGAAGNVGTPGGGSCLGACVPTGCAGMGESRCNDSDACDGGKYGTVCRPKPYCQSGNVAADDFESVAPGDGTGNQCGCETVFAGCSAVAPLHDLRPERSLLVRDGAILEDPAFQLQTVLTKLAPSGQVDAFVRSLLNQVGTSRRLSNGAQAPDRKGFTSFLPEIQASQAGITSRFAKLMHTTSLVNRLDLASAGNCGEARITYAMSSAYVNGDQRMTMIFELKVPDDGNGCKTVAQRWAELSLVDSAAERRTRLIALYDELLKPASLGQLRTNEFINRTSFEAWELREFHLDTSGMPEQVPVAQTVDPIYAQNSALLTWVRNNTAAIKDGTAIIPNQYLAAASTEDGGRIRLPGSSTDKALKETEAALNGLACSGCHLTETKSPFVHVGERLGKRESAGTYRPTGRAVIDEFMQTELPKRATLMKNVLSGTGHNLVAGDWRPAVRTRVH